MCGSEDQSGIVQLASIEIFEKVKQLKELQANLFSQQSSEKPLEKRNESLLPPTVIKKEMKVIVSYIEIYNEKVNDLIDTTRKDLDIREEKKQISIENLSKHAVTTPQQIMQLI